MTIRQRQEEATRAEVIAECCAFLEQYARDHAAAIPKGKHVTPTADTLTRWCRAYLALAIEDLRKSAPKKQRRAAA